MLLNFFTDHDFLPVESCEGLGEVKNVNSIFRAHGSWSSLYKVKCDDGYRLLYGDGDYECKGGGWFPDIDCHPNDASIDRTTSQNYGKN